MAGITGGRHRGTREERSGAAPIRAEGEKINVTCMCMSWQGAGERQEWREKANVRMEIIIVEGTGDSITVDHFSKTWGRIKNDANSCGPHWQNTSPFPWC